MSDTDVRVRFAPSPTGFLHIGGARTLLFNWLLARKRGGALILRIEDTDRTRHVEDSVPKILDDLRWLGLNWDEGPEIGGPAGPYFQSERLSLYQDHLDRLLESGAAYYAFETPEELAAMRERARANKLNISYFRPDPLPSVAEGKAAREAGKPAVVRFKMPGTPIVVQDEILGEVTLAADQLEDFVIQKSDGYPTYHFACVVDDELMNISHVLRGQEHLVNTPKHVAMQQALAFKTPRYAHMPVIFNMDGSKMSKRDKEKAIAKGKAPPEIDVHDFRAAGYLPEAIVNFIALLGWSPGDDREHFSRNELIEAFSLERIGKTNARFDRVKLLSFNTDWAERLDTDVLLKHYVDYLEVNRMPRATADRQVLSRCLKSSAGFRTFPDVDRKTAFAFQADDEIEFDAKAVQKVLSKSDAAGFAMLQKLLACFESMDEWSPDSIENVLSDTCAAENAKLGKVAQPLRVAITGSTVSPSIHESLTWIGKEATLKRIRRCLQVHGMSPTG